jgi:hypothetical protein
MKLDRHFLCGVMQYQMQLVADSLPGQVCGGCGGVILIDVGCQGEVIGADAWETYSYGGVPPRFVVERGDCREAIGTYADGEDWETWSGQIFCWVSSARRGVQGNVHGVDGGTSLGRRSIAVVSVARPSLGPLG